MKEKRKRTLQELRLEIEDNVIQGFDFLQVATENDKIVGYIRAERGKFEKKFSYGIYCYRYLKKI